jgi:hypothetical protein
MPVVRNNGYMRAGCGAAALTIGAALLAGCSSTPGTSEAPALTSRISSFFSSPREAAPPVAPGQPTASGYDCPSVDIRRGAGILNVAAKGSDATAGDLRYQLSLRETARECLVQAGTMTIRVGVQGRVILGPYGGPGQVEVPLRYAIVLEGTQPRTIMTKFKRFSTTVPPGETNVAFTDVEDGLTCPIPSEAELSGYVVYVGFDEIGDRNEKKPAKPAKKKKKAQ